MRKLTVKKWLALILKIALALLVVVFAGSESLNFFNFVFPPSQWYLAYTGFGLTMGAMFVYLYLLLHDADTPLQRTIALIMMLVGLAGELAAAGFGMQIEGWKKLGFALTSEDYEFMILAVRIMMVVHGLALMTYWTGDQIIELLGDHDNDGKRNFADPDYRKNKRSENRPQAQQAYSPPKSTGNNAPKQPQGMGNAPQHSLDEFLRVSGLTREQAQVRFADRDAFMDFASGQFDYISGGNMKKLYWELTGSANPTQAAAQNNGRR